MRKVFLEDLPRWENSIRYNGKIKWKECIGLKVKFIYDNIKDEIEIIKYDGKYLSIKYKNNDMFRIGAGNFSKCKLQGLLREELLKQKYDEYNPRRIDLRNMPLNSNGVDWTKGAENKMKISFIYDDIEGELEVFGYNKDTQCLLVKYKNEDYKIQSSGLLKCELGKIVGKRTSEFKIEIGTILKDEKRDLIITNREYRKDKNGRQYKFYKYQCQKCNWDEGWIVEGHLLEGNGCCCCSNRTVVEGINDIYTTDRWFVDELGMSVEDAKKNTKSNSKKARFVCKNCGRIHYKTINNVYRYKSLCCSCGDSYSFPEKFLYSVLTQLNILFMTQLTKTTLAWCEKYRYDFHIPTSNIIIETHGDQHYSDCKGFKTKLKEQQKIDKYKKQLAVENGIKEGDYVVLDCRYSNLEWIKYSILNSKLNELFDLSIIDWNECEKYAMNSNKVKEVCDYWNNKKQEETTKHLSQHFKISRPTITEYLKKGSKLGWLNIPYNVKEESLKGRKNLGKSNGKLVEVFKNNISLGAYPSCTYLEEYAEKIFNTKLLHGRISEVARGKAKQYKGYTFKYIDEENNTYKAS